MIKNLLRKNRSAQFLCAALVCLLTVSACKKEQPPPPAAQVPKPAPVKAQAVQKPLSSAQPAAAPAVSQFDFSKKKDPFKPFITVKAAPADNAGSGGRSRNSLPIHSFEVNQFKLIGIISGGKDSQAMVTDPGGKGYVLKTGMTIGRNGGKVTSISSRSVDVLEQFRDDNGRVRKETIKLTLPRKQ